MIRPGFASLARVSGMAGVAVAVAGCSSTIDRGRMQRDLEQKDVQFTSRSVQEIEALRPQLEIPFRLAVAPPIWRDDATWTREEREELEAFGKELREIGLVSEFVLIPSVTYEIGGGSAKGDWFGRLREAAARHHADAVLVVRDIDDTSQWANVLSVLDLTIVGCWFVPGHSAEAFSIMQALLIDNRNEYLYASAEGEGAAKDTQPFAYLDGDALRKEARTAALRDLRADLSGKARDVMQARASAAP